MTLNKSCKVTPAALQSLLRGVTLKADTVIDTDADPVATVRTTKRQMHKGFPPCVVYTLTVQYLHNGQCLESVDSLRVSYQ